MPEKDPARVRTNYAMFPKLNGGIDLEETLNKNTDDNPACFKNIVVLADGDNVNVHDAAQALRYVEELGHVTIKRVYGNWSKIQLKDWHDFIMRNGFTAVQQFDAVKGKNATDIALAVDAVDIVNNHNGIDLFVIISSDSDYVAVAAYIKERGCRIIGFGNNRTNIYYRNFLDEFHDVQDLAEKAQAFSSDGKQIDEGERCCLVVHDDADYKIAKLHLIIHRVAYAMAREGKGDGQHMLFCTSFSKRLNSYMDDGKRFSLAQYYSGSLWSLLKSRPDLYDTRDFGQRGKKFRCLSGNLTITKALDYSGTAAKYKTETTNANANTVSDEDKATKATAAKGKAKTTKANANTVSDKDAATKATAAKGKAKATNANANTASDEDKATKATAAKGKAKTTKADANTVSDEDKATTATAAKGKAKASSEEEKQAATAEMPAKDDTDKKNKKTAKASKSKSTAGKKNPDAKIDHRLDKMTLPAFKCDPSIILRYLYIASGKKMGIIAKELSISVGSVSGYVSGNIAFTAKTKMLADYFGVSESFLLGKEPTVVYNGLKHEVQRLFKRNEKLRKG